MNLKPAIDAIPRVVLKVNPLAAYGVTLAITLASFAILQSSYTTVRDDAKTAKILTDQVGGLVAQVAALQQASCDNVRFVYETQIVDLTRRAKIEAAARLPAVEDDLSERRSAALLQSRDTYKQHLKDVCKPSKKQVLQAVKETQVAPHVAATLIPTMPPDQDEANHK